jgi:hypothetical protein
LVNAAAINITGQVNTATLYAATSANIASIVQANSLGVHVGANVVANTTALRVGNTTLTTTNAVFGGTIAANGGIGTAKQVLVSSAGANAYWATLDMSFIPGTTFKESVRAATTADLGGVTATTTTLTASTLVALPAQDGITLIVGDRLLVKDQATPAQNGIYDVTNVGSAGVTAWILTRSADADTIAELASATVGVDSGTVNGGLVFDNDSKSTDTLGTTGMIWHTFVDTGGATFVGNLVMGTGSTGIFPASNTVGVAFGNTIARWNLVANSADFSSTVNAVTSVNSALLTVGTAFIANTTGAYHTGTMNAASHTVGSSFIANSTAIVSTGFANITTSVNSALFTVGALFTANSTLVNAAAINITGSANAASFRAGANVFMNATHMFVSTNATMNTIITANQITLNGANVMTTATTLKVYYSNGTLAFP